MKHFNKGNAWGKIVELRPARDERSLTVHLDCTGPQGSVHVWGRIFNPEVAAKLLEFHKRCPSPTFRFTGFCSQYYNGANDLFNFAFYKWDSATGETNRAAFILKGDLISKRSYSDHGVVKMAVKREDPKKQKKYTEEFDLVCLDGAIFDSIPEKEGSLIEVKGYLQQGFGEDEFGDSSGPVRPVIKQFKTFGERAV
jgi:hypothetical protein